MLRVVPACPGAEIMGMDVIVVAGKFAGVKGGRKAQMF
jgi:hypothetical protein